MELYVIIQSAIIEYEECTNILAVCSSEAKAIEAIARYEDYYKDSPWSHTHYYETYTLDEIWDKFGFNPDAKDDETEE